jgi:signal transduction histidine kinase
LIFSPLLRYYDGKIVLFPASTVLFWTNTHACSARDYDVATINRSVGVLHRMAILSQRGPSTSLKNTLEQPIWHHWRWVWYAFFYGSLLLTDILFLYLHADAQSWPTLGMLGFTLAISLWYLVYIRVDPTYWERHPAIMLLYFAIGWAGWYAFCWPYPDYLFLLTGLCPQVFTIAGLRWKIAASSFLTLLALLRLWETGGDFNPLFMIITTFSVGCIFLGVFVTLIIGQSQQRYQLILELQATRQELALAERRAGIIEERHRLAREIHDTLAQGFTSVIMLATSARTLEEAASTSFKSLRYFEQIERIARENLLESRQLMETLRPDVFTHSSLSAVLENLLQRWSEESGCHARLTVTGDALPLSPELEVFILRVTNEALTNIRKHAHATQVVVTLSYLDDTLALDVQDDGRGFDPAAMAVPSTHCLQSPLSGHFGLTSIRERVTQLHGTFTIESTPGEGTVLTIMVPIASLLPESLPQGKMQ